MRGLSGSVREGFLDDGFLAGLVLFLFLSGADGLYVDDDLEDFAGEGGVALFVVVSDVGGLVDADAGGFVGGEHDGLSFIDVAAGYLVAVDEDGGCAAFTHATTVIGEVQTDSGFAGSDDLGRGDLVFVEAEEVVAEGRPAVFEVEAPAAEAAALRKDDAVRAALWDLHVCGDG